MGSHLFPGNVLEDPVGVGGVGFLAAPGFDLEEGGAAPERAVMVPGFGLMPVHAGIELFSSDIRDFDNLSRDEIEARISAAIEVSKTRSLMTSDNTLLLDDPLKEFNALLSGFGGMTFNSVATDILSAPGTRNETTENSINKHMDLDMQKSILSSIMLADREEDFIDQVEEQYEDLYYTRKGLGTLYSKIKGILSKIKTIEAAKTKVGFKEAVMAKVDTKTIKARKSAAMLGTTKGVLDTKFNLFSYSPGIGLVEASPNNGPVFIYMPIGELPDGVYLVNNVVLAPTGGSSVSYRGTSTGQARTAIRQNTTEASSY